MNDQATENNQITQENLTSPQTPLQASTPSGQSQIPVSVVPTEVSEEGDAPFYTQWAFWVLVVLIVVLFGVIAFFLVPAKNSFLEAEMQVSAESVKLHVKNLTAPRNGFLVLQKDENGVPGAIFEISPFLVPDHYKDFFIPFTPDEYNDDVYYQDLGLNGTFYVTYYLDNDSTGTYKKEIDTTIGKDQAGKPLQIKIVSGKMVQE